MALSIQFEVDDLFHKLLVDDSQLTGHIVLLINEVNACWLPKGTRTFLIRARRTHERSGL